MRNGFLVGWVLWTGTSALAAPVDAPNPEIAKIVSEVSADRIERTIKRLAAFGTRHTLSETESDTRGIGAARRWIKAELEQCGRGTPLEVSFDEHDLGPSARVPAPGVKLVNVVARLPGSQPESRSRVYVVSGHYDSMRTDVMNPAGEAPGADDDASGTAVAMELACVMARHRVDATLVFMAVAGEEQGLLGSTAFAKAAREKNVDIAGMFTNDIVGNSHGADGTRHADRLRLFAEGVPASETQSPALRTQLGTGGENDGPTRQLARTIKAAADRYVTGTRVEVIWRRDRYLRGGDHFPFLEAGYPAVRFTEPVEDWRHQHQDVRVEGGVQYGDLPEFVDFAYVAQVARINGAALASLALAPSSPRDVEMEALRLEADTTIRWAANPEPDVAGYRIVWRDTTAADWQHVKDVGLVTRYTLQGVSKDDFSFGVQAYDRDGNVSVATYPRPMRRPVAPAATR